MTGHFLLLEFLGKIPTELLQAYCERRGILADFHWGGGRRVEPERLADALHSLLNVEVIVAEFRAIHDMADAGLTVGLFNEARFYNDDGAFTSIEA